MADINRADNSRSMKIIMLAITASFLAAAAAGAVYTGDFNILPRLKMILISPCPRLTDYFELGSLAAAFVNAFLCGISISLLAVILKIDANSMVFAGYMLVIAHTFFGLNFLNMWPPFLGIWIVCRLAGKDFNDMFATACFATNFGPFFSEILFRYTAEKDYVFGQVNITPQAVVFTILFALVLGFVFPAMLVAAKGMHKGYDYFNAGLASGMTAIAAYAFFFKSFGRAAPSRAIPANPVYESFGHSYGRFIIVYYILLFGLCGIAGLVMNKGRADRLSRLFAGTGLGTDILGEYGAGYVLLNFSIHGFMMLGYYTAVIALTEGAGFTGATTGVILASLTFTAASQHAKNVYPIIIGYAAFGLFVRGMSALSGTPRPWTLSTQGYISGIACGTGMAAITGEYGKRYGIIAGALFGAICWHTGVMHGGFILYNGGFGAGLTAFIVIAVLEHYKVKKVYER